MGLGGFAAGFAKGLAGSIHENERAKREEEAKQRELANKAILDLGSKDFEVSQSPEFAQAMQKTYGKLADPLIAAARHSAIEIANRPSQAQFFGQEPMTQVAPVPTTAPTAEPSFARVPVPGITPPAPSPEAATTPGAPAPAIPTAPAPSPIARLQAKIPEGVRVPVKLREGTIYVTGQNQKEADERAYWHAYMDTKNALVDAGLPEPDAGFAAHEQTVQQFVQQERSVPKEARAFSEAGPEALRRGLLARTDAAARKEIDKMYRENAAGIRPGSGTPLLTAEAAARAGGSATGKAEAEGKQPIDTKEIGLWYDTKTGKELPGTVTKNEARQRGIRVTDRQKKDAESFATANGMIEQALEAGKYLFTSNSNAVALVNAAAYKAAADYRLGTDETVKNATKILDFRKNMIGFLRSAFKERGNFAARLAESALESTVSFYETDTSFKARMEFMASVLIAGRKSTGVPLTPYEDKLYRKLDTLADKLGVTEKMNLPKGASVSALLMDREATDPPPTATEDFNNFLGTIGVKP